MTANCPTDFAIFFFIFFYFFIFQMRNAKTADSVELKVYVVKPKVPYRT